MKKVHPPKTSLNINFVCFLRLEVIKFLSCRLRLYNLNQISLVLNRRRINIDFSVICLDRPSDSAVQFFVQLLRLKTDNFFEL